MYHVLELMSRTELKRFGQKLRTLRTRHGMTTKVMAETLGLKSHSYMSELETGKKEPTALFVLKVARFFHVTTDQLLKDELDLE